MAKPSAKRQRRFSNLLINPRYQLRYVLWLTLQGILLVALYSALVYSYVRENYSILVELSPISDEARGLLYRELTEIIVRLGLLSALFAVMVSFLGVFFSHRTAGPLYHFKRIFADVRKGDLEARVRLRPGDDFRDVAQEFNAMMDSLQEKAGGPRAH
jgi:methyl-accepting chemotaxis protein